MPVLLLLKTVSPGEQTRSDCEQYSSVCSASQENTKACAALLDVCEESFSDNDYLARACSCVPANIGKFYHGQDIPEQDCIGGVANYRPVGTKQLAACAAVANLGQR